MTHDDKAPGNFTAKSTASTPLEKLRNAHDALYDSALRHRSDYHEHHEEYREAQAAFTAAATAFFEQAADGSPDTPEQQAAKLKGFVEANGAAAYQERSTYDTDSDAQETRHNPTQPLDMESFTYKLAREQSWLALCHGGEFPTLGEASAQAVQALRQ